MERLIAIMVLIWMLVSVNMLAQDKYPRIVGDIGLGGGIQYATAIGDYSETASGGIGIFGYMEYALTSRLVLNFNYTFQNFSSNAPDTLIIANEIYFADDLSARHTLNSILFGGRFYSHAKSSKQLYFGVRTGLELIKNKLESDRSEEGVLTTIEESTATKFAISSEVGIRFKFKTVKMDLSGIYNTFSSGGYWGIRLGIFGAFRKW